MLFRSLYRDAAGKKCLIFRKYPLLLGLWGGMGAVPYLPMSLLEVWIKKIHKNHSVSSIQGAEFVTVCDNVPLPVNS